ncbi:MAG: universal stress protein [Simkaniaceae bacterium]|nr:universal stress protein [Simkaniaceae bacterium]
MKRSLGIADLFAIGYGDLGSSIYYALGITALYSLGATPLSLLIAGIIFVCTALSYAELSSMLKDSGGTASYSRTAFNDLISFIAGWGLLLDFIVTIAISAFSVAPYLSFFFHRLAVPGAQVVFSVILIMVLCLINCIGAKQSTRLSWWLTSLTLFTQVVIIAIGAYFLLDMKVIEHLKIGVNEPWSPSWPQFLKGTVMAMVAYTGIESMAQLSAEAKNPSKTVPRAIMIAMVVLLIMYIGITSVALSAMPVKDLGTTYVTNPIAGIVAFLPVGGDWLSGWVAILGAMILFVAANAGLIGSSRLAFNMGEFYQLPHFIYKLHPTLKTPYVSLALFGIVASLIIIWSGGSLDFLADLYNFGAMLAFSSAHLALISLRIKQPQRARPFKVGLGIKIKGKEIPFTALFGGLATLTAWVLVVITKPEGRYLGLLWIVVGLAIYFFYRRRHDISPVGHLKIQKIQVPEYEKVTYKKILVPTRGGLSTPTIQMACEIARKHKAEITAVHIFEIPFTLPLSLSSCQKPKHIDELLKQVEAVGREFQVSIEAKLIFARSVADAVIEVAEEGKYDLIVLGGVAHALSGVTEKIIKGAHLPVWVCFTP